MTKEYLMTEVSDDNENEEILSSRDLYLTEDVNEESIQKLIKEIIKFNRIDDKQEKKIVNFKRQPIFLYINSPGGDAYTCFGLIDVINESVTPVYTKVIGIAASAAGIIFMAGRKRFMGEYATLMYHNVWTIELGDQYTFKNEIKELNRLQILIDKLYMKNSSLSMETLNNWKKSKIDKFIDYRMAKRWKMITDD